MAKNKRAFDASRGNIFLFDPEDLVLIEDKDHPLYDERIHLEVDESMIRNVMTHGVIQPIVVVKMANEPVVLAGRQRVKAALHANERLTADGQAPIKVPAVVRRGRDGDLFAVSVSENELRSDDSPLVRADKALRLLNMGRTEEEVAIAFGVSAVTIRNWLKLTELHGAVQHAVDGGEISATAAIQLHGLETKEQKAKLKKLISEGGKPTVRKAKKVVRKGGYRFRKRKEILEGMDEDMAAVVKPFLAGTTPAKIASIVTELNKGNFRTKDGKPLSENAAWVALSQMVEF